MIGQLQNCNAGSCRICEQRHHTLLHISDALLNDRNISGNRTPPTTPPGTRKAPLKHPNDTPPTQSCPRPSSNPQRQSDQWRRRAGAIKETDSLTTTSTNALSNDLLTTACVNILNNKVRPVRCRALLDTGSSMNFITERLATSLRLPQHKRFQSELSIPYQWLRTVLLQLRSHPLTKHTQYSDVLDHTDNLDINSRSTHRSIRNLDT